MATFMGKPFNDQGGSGFHVHLSLARDGGTNAFDDTARPAPDSACCGAQFVAGLIEHAPALDGAARARPMNAYKRLVPDSLAPTHVNWGLDNRTSFVPHPERARAAPSRVEVAPATAAPRRT